MDRAADPSADYDPLGDLDPVDEAPGSYGGEAEDGADTADPDPADSDPADSDPADRTPTDSDIASTGEEGTHEESSDATPDADSGPEEPEEGPGDAPPADETGQFDPMDELSDPEELDEADPVADEATPDEEPFDPVADLAVDDSDPDLPEAEPAVDLEADAPETQTPADLVDVSTVQETPEAAAPGGTPAETDSWGTPAETAQVEPASEETGEQLTEGLTAVADQLGESGDEVRRFGSNQDGAEYGRQHWSEVYGQLTDDQRAALHGYTCEKQPGESGPPDYKDINGALRGYAPMTEEVRQAVGNLDQALELRPVPEDVMVIRETGWNALAGDIDDLVGSVQQDPGYLSTALGNEPTFDKNADVVLHLEVPAGTPAMYLEGLSEYGGERELLLGRGQKYEVTDVRDEEDGRFHVYGRIVTGG